MIIRIVKMTFRPDEIQKFLELFESRKHLIRRFEGCSHLELWQQEHEGQVFFTYSHWEDEAALNKYRISELFKDTWAQTKVLFQQKAEAWSVQQKIEIH